MNKYILRVICIALAAITVILTAVSCAETKQPADETVKQTEGSTETEKVHADLPDMNLGGYTFSVAHWLRNDWPTRINIDIYAEDFTGDPINDAVYKRNTRLGEAYNFEVEFEAVEAGELVNKTRQFVSSQEDVYDLVYILASGVSGLLIDGSFLDFENAFKYVDLDKPYWDQEIRKNLSFLDHTFLMASSMNIIDEDATAGVGFNKQIAKDQMLPNFYEIVNAGNWTFEQVYDQMTSFDGDVNGDGNLTEQDDIYGFLGGDDVFISFFYGAGGRFTEKDEYDLPFYVFGEEDNINIILDLFDICYDPVFLNHHAIKNGTDPYYRQLFIDGHGLFFWMRMDDARALRGEEAIDFGILPIPKWDETQKEHISMVSRHTTGYMSVLNSERDPDTVGFIMEAMAAASYYDLTYAYYDVTLKTKSTRDDESQDMLDLIFAHRTTDIGDVFNFGGFTDIMLRYCSQNKTRNIASSYAQYESKIEDAIDKFYDEVERLEQRYY
ncbi:MAG: hypothetical protein MJ070_11195 [Lachnospiraceae bacterium]|nr:hypothetical protein [Lachnospiraceae bacterium]